MLKFAASTYKKEEFVEVCYLMGYCKKELSRAYSKHRNKLTDNDIINVYRIYQQDYENLDEEKCGYKGAKYFKEIAERGRRYGN